MCDLNEQQIRLIDVMVKQKVRKEFIAKEIVHCHRSTIYNHLKRLYPADGSTGAIHKRKRKSTIYKGSQQTLQDLEEYILCHRFCTLKDIVRDLDLNVCLTTVHNWLKKIGIGTYTAVTKQYLSPENIVKRYFNLNVSIFRTQTTKPN